MSNRRQPSLTIPQELLKGLDPQLAQALNDRFKQVEDLHSSTAGLRGPVQIAKQKKVDTQKKILAGLNLQGGAIGGVADPRYGDEVVTKSYLERRIQCSELVRILENCAEHEELLDDEIEVPEDTQFTVSPAYIMGISIWAVYGGLSSSAPGVDTVVAMLWALPFKYTFNEVVFDVSSAGVGKKCGVGLYTGTTRQLIFQTTPVDVTTGVKSNSVGPITLDPGMYWLAHTFGAGGPRTIDIFNGNAEPTLNSGVTRCGYILSAGNDGILPSTLGTLTELDATSKNPIYAMFVAPS